MKTGRTLLLKLIAAVAFSSLPLMLLSQEPSTCAENLKSAQSQFDKGHVELISGLISDCMKSGFKREEQLSAYKLLIQSYLFEDKLETADSAMLTFLKRYPEYMLSPTDHSSFVYLFNSFRVKPVLQLTFHIGLNLPYVSFVTQRSHSSEPNPGVYKTDMLNIFGSVEAKYALNKKFDVNVELGLSQIKFTNEENYLDFATIKYIETQLRIEIPVSVTYNIISLGKLTPFVRVGFGAALDISSTAKCSQMPLDINGSEIRTGADISISDSRTFIDLFPQTGIGLKFKTPGGFISLEGRLNSGMFNQHKEGANTNGILDSFYMYADDDFHLNTMNISFGYTQIFYKPSKRK